MPRHIIANIQAAKLFFTVQNLATAEVLKDTGQQAKLYDIYFREKKTELDNRIVDISIKKEERRINGTQADIDEYKRDKTIKKNVRT